MPKSKSMIAVVAGIIAFCGAAESGFAQRLFPPPPPVGPPPIVVGKAVGRGAVGIGRAVGRGVTGIGRAVGRGAVGIGKAAGRGIFGPRVIYAPRPVYTVPTGYHTMTIGGQRYYYYPQLPVGYRTVWLNGRRYYVYNNVYYSPYNYGGSTIYLVIPPPY